MDDSYQRELTTADLEALSSSLENLVIPEKAGLQERVIRAIRNYVVPRIENPRLPLTVVFAGPTGAGKSTLLNSVAGAVLSDTGALRPTTMAPVVFADEQWAGAYRNLGGVECEVIDGRAPILKELTLVDTPDIDSTSSEHRAIAENLIDNADVVVFVSSALRYADLVPWEVLRRALAREVPVIPVLNRIRPDTSGSLHDYRRLLDAERVTGEPVGIGEHHLAPAAQRIPSGSIRELRKRLVAEVGAHQLASSHALRRVVAVIWEQAQELIETAENYAAAQTARRASVTDPFDAGSIEIAGDLDQPFPRYDEVMALEGRRSWRIRWWKRFHRADEAMLADMRTSVIESVVADQQMRLRAKLASTDRPFTTVEYELVRFAVEHWMYGARSGLPPTDDWWTRVLVAAETLRPGGSAGEMLSVLEPSIDLNGALSRSKASLIAELEAVYAMVREAVGRSVPPASPPLAIERARKAMSDVVARFSFADA